MNRTNFCVASLFLALGVYLSVSAYRLPAGMGRLPGPGFYPSVVGAVIVILAGVLLAVSLRGGRTAGFRISNGRPLAATLLLLGAYLLLWDAVPFAIRTSILLVVFLRLLGERWRSALGVAAVLTLAVILAFQYGLRVDL